MSEEKEKRSGGYAGPGLVDPNRKFDRNGPKIQHTGSKRDGGKVLIDYETLKALVTVGTNLVPCAHILEISPMTLKNRIREDLGISFVEYKEKYFQKTLVSLKTRLVNAAIQGNISALIFSLKALGGLREFDNKNDIKIELNYKKDLPELDSSIQRTNEEEIFEEEGEVIDVGDS